MPSIEEIQQYLIGAWRMMLGKADGLRMLDLSADGFWNSFFAILVAAPALLVGWTAFALEASPGPGMYAARMGLLPRLAFIDLCIWVLPLAALALAARPAGVGDRFVHYVVSSNWASALIAWLMLPPALLRLLVPSVSGVADILSLALFVASMALTWRLTNVAIGKGASIATAVFAGMFVISLAVLIILQALLGLNAPDQIPAG